MVTLPNPLRGTPPHHLTRARRLSRTRVRLVGVGLALTVLAAALIAVELRMRRAEPRRPVELTGTVQAESPHGTLIPSPHAMPLMLVDEASCYVGFAPRSEQYFRRDGTPLWHRHVSDGDGFRVDPSAPPRAAACRVLAVGDSFTAGLYVEASRAWPAALEAKLRARGYSVRVDNGGLQGHTITQERAEVLSRWASLRPRVVVVGRTSNDVQDVLSLQRSGCRIGGPAPQVFEPSLPEPVRDLRLVAGALEARARLRVMTSRLRETLRGGRQEVDGPSCAAAEGAYIAEARDLVRGAARASARVLFAVFEHSWCGEGQNHQDAAAFEARMSSALAAEGARSVDLKSALEDPGARLSPWDNHPSPSGHDALAAGVAADLVASGWLEGCR